MLLSSSVHFYLKMYFEDVAISAHSKKKFSYAYITMWIQIIYVFRLFPIVMYYNELNKLENMSFHMNKYIINS